MFPATSVQSAVHMSNTNTNAADTDTNADQHPLSIPNVLSGMLPSATVRPALRMSNTNAWSRDANANPNRHGYPGHHPNSDTFAFADPERDRSTSLTAPQPIHSPARSDRRQCWYWRVHRHGKHPKTYPSPRDWTVFGKFRPRRAG